MFALVACAHGQEATLRGISGGPSAPVRSLAVSPNGTQLFVGGGVDRASDPSGSRAGDGKLYALPGLKLVGTLHGLTRPVLASAFSADGRFLATGGGYSDDATPGTGELCMWDAATGALVRRFPGAFPISAVSFTGDGEWIIARSDINITLWRTDFGGMIDNVDSGRWSACAISPDHIHYALSYSDTLGSAHVVRTELRVLPYRAVERQIVDTTREVSALAFNADGRRLAIAFGDTIRLRNLETGALIRTFVKPKASIASLAISKDGAYLAAGDRISGALYLWQTATGKELLSSDQGTPIEAFGELGAPARATAFLNNQCIATGGDDRTVRTWGIPGGTLGGSLISTHRDEVLALSFSHGGDRLVTAARDSAIIFWSTADLLPRLHIPAILGLPVQCVQFMPDGASAVVAADTLLYTLSATDGSYVRLGPLPGGHTTAISENCRYVAVGRGFAGVGTPSFLTVHACAAGAPVITRLDVQENAVEDAAFSQDGSLLVASTSDAVYCWDLPSGRLRWRRAMESPTRVAVDGAEVFISGKWPMVRSAVNGDSLRLIPQSAVGSGPLVLTTDGIYGVSADTSGALRRWNAMTGESLPATQLGFRYSSVAVSADSRLVAAAANDGSVTLWDSGLPASTSGLASEGAPGAAASDNRSGAMLRPWNSPARIDYSIPESTMVTLELFDVGGVRVRELVRRQEEAGEYSVPLPSELPTGVYLVRLTTGAAMTSRLMSIGR